MNKIIHICRDILENPQITQRELALKLNISLGAVNNYISKAIKLSYIEKSTSSYIITEIGKKQLENYKVDNAVIIAAGFGSRFVPLTYDTPKGLLKVYGEKMIERQIKQLHEVGIFDITIVVGYLKEKFEYLIDKFKVKLLYNPEFKNKNTLATLYHAKDLFYNKNTYLLASDNWLRNNMYHLYEPNSWYSASYMEGNTKEWCISYNKKGVITKLEVGGSDSYVMYGPAYFDKAFSNKFFPIIESYYKRTGTEEYYWEQVLMDLINSQNNPLPDIYINPQPKEQVYEFENLEELRAFDEHYNHSSDNEAMKLISNVFNIPEYAITDIKCLKAGMTNKSFLFSINLNNRLKINADDINIYKNNTTLRYICRIPGKGTEDLIDRKAEYENYKAVNNLYITENIIYFDYNTGYKISEFYENSRNSDFHNQKDIESCMEVLRTLHKSSCTVNHEFNIEERINFYEKLCLKSGEIPFEDYNIVRQKMNELISYLKTLDRTKVLAHIDSVSDNFLFVNVYDREEIRLIDWEYAGMADPLIDIAMSSIYSYFNKEETLNLLETYLEHTPTDLEKKIVYAYMALGGFAWTLWAVYKSSLGETFGEYTLIMYRYAKDYYNEVMNID